MTSDWFEVRATLRVKAADREDAINRVAGALRVGNAKEKAIFLVGNFDAAPTDDPVEELRTRHRIAPESA